MLCVLYLLDLQYLCRYPKGKHCTFVMSINKLMDHLKVTTFPIQMFIVDHTKLPLKIMAQGFFNDKHLLGGLTNLSMAAKKNHSKVFYERSVVIPVFQEASKFPVGSVTLKITAKISSDHHLVTHSNPSHTDPMFSDPFGGPPLTTKELTYREYLPNVWFPPPLCFTSNTVTDDMSSSKSVSNHYKQKDACTTAISNEVASSLLTVNHWTAVAEYKGGTLPWKGDVVSHLMSMKDCTQLDPPSVGVAHHEPGGNHKGTAGFQDYPCLSTLYKELISLHDDLLNCPADRENVGLTHSANKESIKKKNKSQSVQTDPVLLLDENKKCSMMTCTAAAILRPVDKQTDQIETQSWTHKSQRASSDTNVLNDDILEEFEEGRKKENDDSLLETRVQMVVVPPALAISHVGTDHELDDAKPKVSLKNNNELIPAVDKDTRNSNSQQGMANDDLNTSMHSSSSSSSSNTCSSDTSTEASHPFVPILTLSQPSTTSIPSQRNVLATNSNTPCHLDSPQLSHTNLLTPLHPLQSMESTLIASNEVRCGNPCLGQKVYLTASLQSIDHESSSRQPEAESNDEATGGTSSHLDNGPADQHQLSNDQIEYSNAETSTSISFDSTEIVEEIELSDDYYSEDFESDSSQ